MSWSKGNTNKGSDGNGNHEDNQSALSLLAKIVLQKEKSGLADNKARPSTQSVGPSIKHLQSTSTSSKTVRSIHVTHIGGQMISRTQDFSNSTEKNGFLNGNHNERILNIHVEREAPVQQTSKELKQVRTVRSDRNLTTPQESIPKIQKSELAKADVENYSTNAPVLKIKDQKPSILLEELERIRSLSVQALPTTAGEDTKKEKLASDL